jgi:hypothetical protein
MNTTGLLSRRSGERIVIGLDVLQNVRGAYVRAMTKKCTTSEATELGVLRGCQLGLLVGQQIGECSLSGLNIWVKITVYTSMMA